MPLKVIRRRDTGTLQITGIIELPDGTKRRVRQRSQSDDRRLAEEEANSLEKQILRDAWHGERRVARSFAEAVVSYLNAEPRAKGDRRRLNRILRALGDVPLSAVDQAALDQVRDKMGAKTPATVRRGIITPIRAVLRHAHRRGWCDAPSFEIPRQPAGRTAFLLPAEAEGLIAAGAPHLKPLLLFLLCTGARLAEALELDWREVDLVGRKATLWRKGKPRRRHVVDLVPRTVVELAALPHREGPVFRWETKRPQKPDRHGRVKRDGKAKRVAAYADREREGGGQIKNAFGGALARAGLSGFTPHDLRHTWASWHYALYRDLLRLRFDGCWSSVALVERYAHLMPAGQEAEIRAFWHVADTAASADAASA